MQGKAEIEKEFNRAYFQYIGPIYRFFYLKTDSQEIAEDLASETFLRLWKTLSSGENINNPRAFLYKIARNLLTDFYRKKAQKTEISLDSAPEIIDSDNFQQRIINNSEIERIKKAMQGLKEEYQLVIIWHYLEDIPIKEIAEIMEKTEGNIRVLLHRALQALKNSINY
ncbi:MAG: RNA polymerase sigma factor [bacterium]|nr:RNA polymerase sigma factor [bacterium]